MAAWFRLLPPSAVEYSFERHIIFMISRSEIMKMMCLSKYNSARSAKLRQMSRPPLFNKFLQNLLPIPAPLLRVAIGCAGYASVEIGLLPL